MALEETVSSTKTGKINKTINRNANFLKIKLKLRRTRVEPVTTSTITTKQKKRTEEQNIPEAVRLHKRLTIERNQREELGFLFLASIHEMD